MSDTQAQIKVEEFADRSEDPAGAFTRGHFGADDFLAAVRAYLAAEWGEMAGRDALDGIEARHVEQVFWREEPWEGDGVIYRTCRPAEKGAYPVTRLRWDSDL